MTDRLGVARSPTPVDRILPGLLIFWAGLSVGVAFLATPVKFLAPSLSMQVALDVGRQTFRAYAATEMVLIAFALVLGVRSGAKARWYRSLAIPALAVGIQWLWLLPALDDRVAAVLTGSPELASSQLHAGYIWLEAIKVASLLAFGISQLRAPRSRIRLG